MEAHFIASAVNAATFGDALGGAAPYPSHLVLSESCLAAFDVPTFLLADGNNFYTEVQVRFHGCLRCTPWQRVFSVYAPSRALDRILLPDLGGWRTGPFRMTYDSGNSWGGLFITVPVFCDPEKLSFDGYTAVAIRLAICGAPDEFYEMLFTYDEIAQPRTRFFADTARFDALALQICEFHIPASWSPYRKEEFLKLRNKLVELIAVERQTRSLDKVLRADSYITHNKPLILDPVLEDEVSLEAKKKEADDAVRKLKEAAEKAVTRGGPQLRHQQQQQQRERGDQAPSASGHHHDTYVHEARDAVRTVASGLSSIVRGLGGASSASTSTSMLADSRYSDALLAGLEPPGRSRGEQKTQRAPPDLESVIMADHGRKSHRDAPKPPASTASGTMVGGGGYSIEECLKALCAIISDLGASPQTAWTFGPISIASHACYNSGSPILVVTYSHRGKRVYPPLVPGTTALSEALLSSGAAYPTDLSAEAREELLKRAPCFACPLGTSAVLEYQKLFSVDSEQVFLFGLQARVTTALITSLTVAVTRAIDRATDTMPLNQMVSYDLQVRDADYPASSRDPWPAKLAMEAADLIAGFCAILQTERFSVFARSGLWKAVLTHLASEDAQLRLPFLAPFHLDPAVYLFDYFRFGMGNVSRVTGDPNVVRLKPARRSGLSDCEFISGSASPSHPWAVHKFLPGQFHSYLCMGINSELEGLIIFPGGFGLKFDLGETLGEVWDKNLDSVVLDRYSRRSDSARLGVSSDGCEDYAAAAETECACPCLRLARRPPNVY